MSIIPSRHAESIAFSSFRKFNRSLFICSSQSFLPPLWCGVYRSFLSVSSFAIYPPSSQADCSFFVWQLNLTSTFGHVFCVWSRIMLSYLTTFDRSFLYLSIRFAFLLRQFRPVLFCHVHNFLPWSCEQIIRSGQLIVAFLAFRLIIVLYLSMQWLFIAFDSGCLQHQIDLPPHQSIHCL